MFRILGMLLLVESVLVLMSAGVSCLYAEPDMWRLGISALITFSVGFPLFFFNRDMDGKMDKQRSFVLIVLSWLLVVAFGALPFLLTGALPRIEDAFFEAMSGFTTTGSSVIADVESLSHGILFWRSLTQWVGGFSVIVVTVALMPLLGMRELAFLAVESHESSSVKLLPRIVESLNWLWGVYFLFTVVEAVSYYFAGMGVFDAVCHAFSTISTGGFSTKNESIAHWHSSTIEMVVLLFMFFSGINFTLLFYLLRGRVGKLFRNEEFRYYVVFILVFSMLLSAGLMIVDGTSFLSSARFSVFHVVSVMTTSGFLTQDYMMWPSSLWVLLYLLMLVGASAGSASGGVKIVRAALLLKCSRNEFYLFMHPNAILPVRFNGRLVPLSVLNNVFVFILLYIMMLVLGTFLLTCIDLPLEDSFGYVLSAIGNVGYNAGMDAANPIAQLPVLAKGILSFYMLMGRIDLYILFFFFSRGFWRK
ncbi:MAG: TrkH family potassium uptake protein [Paludibacteraceae bacterium]|nr:TrkH family potassium uptake protein [Paludibacteraceae bacterium]